MKITTAKSALSAVCLSAMLNATPAHATDPVGLTFELLGKGRYDVMDVNIAKLDQRQKWDLKLSTKSDSDVYIVRNTVAPGGSLGWHSHPGPTMVTIIKGTVRLYEGSDPACGYTEYTAGQGFTEIGLQHPHNLRNATGETAQVIAVHIVPAGAPRRIDEPKPTNCPVF